MWGALPECAHLQCCLGALRFPLTPCPGWLLLLESIFSRNAACSLLLLFPKIPFGCVLCPPQLFLCLPGLRFPGLPSSGVHTSDACVSQSPSPARVAVR